MTIEHSYKFDWHDDEQTSEFLRYMWISLMGSQGSNSFAELMDATTNGHAIELSFTVNGIEMDTKKLVEGLERNFEISVQKEVSRIVQEAGLSELINAVGAVENGLKEIMKEKFKAVGIEVVYGEEDW